jgi:hypothetical protein
MPRRVMLRGGDVRVRRRRPGGDSDDAPFRSTSPGSFNVRLTKLQGVRQAFRAVTAW